jgi:hypothetical protein
MKLSRKELAKLTRPGDKPLAQRERDFVDISIRQSFDSYKALVAWPADDMVQIFLDDVL